MCVRDARPGTRPSIVLYEIDEQEAEHALSLNNYHKEGTGDADCQHWVLQVVYERPKKLSMVS